LVMLKIWVVVGVVKVKGRDGVQEDVLRGSYIVVWPAVLAHPTRFLLAPTC
jgi:hypothetical protein